MSPLRKALIEQHLLVFVGSEQTPGDWAEVSICPSCDSDQRALEFVKDGFRHVRCMDCSLLYVSPRLSDQATLDFYNSPANEIYNEGKFHVQSAGTDADDLYNVELLHWTLDFAVVRDTEPTILDIGAARGTLLREAERKGFVSHGIEINTVNAKRLDQEFPGRIYDRDLLALNLPSNSFDCIVLRDVIEHIAWPRPFLAECKRILKPGGVISIATHNIDGLIHKLVGRSHTVIFGFEHPLHWSPKSLGDLLRREGLQDLTFRMGSDSPALKYRISDISLSRILTYLLAPSFTWIYPSMPRLRPSTRWLLRIMNNRFFGLRNPAIACVDNRVWNLMASALNKEAYFCVLARKPLG